MALICVDFDHTLVEGDQPIPGAREAINILREAGHKIMIYSANNRAWIETTLNNADIRYDSIWTGQGKPLCDLYVDDKSYHFKGDWSNEVNDVLNRVKDLDNRKWQKS